MLNIRLVKMLVIHCEGEDALKTDHQGKFSEQEVWRYYLQMTCFLSANPAHPGPRHGAMPGSGEEGGRPGAGWRVVPVPVPSFHYTDTAHCLLVMYPKLASHSLSALQQI